MTLQERSIADKIDRQLTHRNAARSVTAMAAMLAHEVKNPLSGIRGAAQLLEENAGAGRPRADPAHLRRDRPHLRAGRPHGRVLRPPADRAQRRSTSTRCWSACASVAAIGLRAPCALHRGLRSRRCRRCDGNRDLLIQVFLNLVKNAAEAVPDAGRRDRALDRLSATACGSPSPAATAACICRWWSRVTDNGEGIPEDLRPHLFDPFVTTKHNGTGLGLALVAKVIGDHGGVIEFDSQPRRTVFRVYPADGAAAHGSASVMTRLDHPRRRRRPRHPHRAEPGAGAARPRGAHHRQCRDAVALGVGRRGRSRHHRRGDARRERARPRAAHQEAAARAAHHRDERAEHAADRGQGDRARRLRISAQAVRSARAGQRRAARA